MTDNRFEYEQYPESKVKYSHIHAIMEILAEPNTSTLKIIANFIRALGIAACMLVLKYMFDQEQELNKKIYSVKREKKHPDIVNGGIVIKK